jgi:hypothetical protein
MKKLFLALVVAFLSLGAMADELNDLLQGKLVEYRGICRFDQNDMLVFRNGDDVKQVKCLVGFEPEDPTDKKFVLLFLNDEPTVLLEYSLVRKAQRVLWKRGSV